MDPLTAPEFLPAAACRSLRAAYDAGLRSGRLKPRGTDVTDVALSVVTADPVAKSLPGRIAAALRDHFPTLPPLRLDYIAYTRMTAGGRHERHADNGRADVAQRVASAMLYLSDGELEFEGGRLVFPGRGQSFTPKPGLLVGFPSGPEYEHEVPAVESGVRDAIAVWFQAAKDGEPVVPEENPAAAKIPAKAAGFVVSPKNDPYGWLAGGASKLLEIAEDLPGREVLPTPAHAARFRALAARLVALAKLAEAPAR